MKRLAVLLFLAACSRPDPAPTPAPASRPAARADADLVYEAVEQFIEKNGRAPTRLSDLPAPQVDPWGTPYYFTVRSLGEHPYIDVLSAGPDRLLGTDDDVGASPTR